MQFGKTLVFFLSSGYLLIFQINLLTQMKICKAILIDMVIGEGHPRNGFLITHHMVIIKFQAT